MACFKCRKEYGSSSKLWESHMKQGLTDQSKKFKFFLSVVRSHWTILRQRGISYIYIYIYIYIYTHTHIYIYIYI